MRIPFLKKNIVITCERYEFIKESRGGSFMLFSGAIFWYVAFIIATIAPLKITGAVYTYGGLAVPVIGFIILKMQHLNISKNNQYTWLAIFSSIITPFCFPLLILVAKYDMRLVPPTLCIINGAHLLILMWIHLEYIYAIMSMAYFIIGINFMFNFQKIAMVYVGLSASIVSVIGGFIIYLNTKTPLQGYKVCIKK